MKIKIIAIGKIAKSSPEDIFLNEYLKRIKWKVSVIEIPDSTKENKKLDDASKITSQLTKDDFVVVLDEIGKNIATTEFKDAILECQRINKNIVFIIGGADGLDQSVKNIANLMISFGKMTLPHKLVRVLLAEQIYRAYSIITNHPYHRE